MSTREYPVSKTDEQWRAELSPEEYRVLRQAGTERPFTGEYHATTTTGVYSCRACGNELFRSDTKFDAHCGWPSFYSPSDTSAVRLERDYTLGMVRTEVLCAQCGSHLGHVFDDVPRTPAIDGRTTSPEDFPQPEGLGDGAQRYCMNSISMRLEPTEG